MNNERKCSWKRSMVSRSDRTNTFLQNCQNMYRWMDIQENSLTNRAHPPMVFHMICTSNRTILSKYRKSNSLLILVYINIVTTGRTCFFLYNTTSLFYMWLNVFITSYVRSIFILCRLKILIRADIWIITTSCVRWIIRCICYPYTFSLFFL